MDDPIARNLAEVKARIVAAAADSGRPADSASLVAVSKTVAPEGILSALRAGHRLFGENRVQEAEAKWPALKAAYPDAVLHLIGPLQRNKLRKALALFDVIETLDRPRLAVALAEEMGAGGRRVPCFIQINTGEEAQKAGVPPADADAFIRTCRDDLALPIAGLMCIPPAAEEPAPHFALLAKIAARNGLDSLSMGMSHDFEIAIRFGATLVRVGTAIFGVRS
ncbi:MAG: YggS family pyridoxal phosphate-dependent enzyme [Magnetospirillum sp. WYHS-4]